MDLQTSYQELLKGRPYTLATGSFEDQEWGSWYAFALRPSPLVGSTTDAKGRKKTANVSRDLHVSFIKVKYGSKDSTNAQNVVTAIREAAAGKEITLQLTQVKCT